MRTPVLASELPGGCSDGDGCGNSASSPPGQYMIAMEMAKQTRMSSERQKKVHGERSMAVALPASEHWQRQEIRFVPNTSSLKLLPVSSRD